MFLKKKYFKFSKCFQVTAMLSGSLKVTPLAALSRFCICHKFSINLYSSIFVFQASSRGEREDNNCEHAWQQQVECPPFYILSLLYKSIILISNNCEHAWQQQGEFFPSSNSYPCYVWMIIVSFSLSYLS